jgi:hypothetical protein
MYLDPSFGGMFLQIIVAIAAGGGVIIFGMRRKIKALFKKNKNDTAANVKRQAAADGEEDIVDMLAGENNGKG